MAKIKLITSREIIDSRGIPTVETKVILDDTSFGVASVPSGASVGRSEALELRDGDLNRFGGLGVLKAVANVSEVIAPAIKGMEAEAQFEIDQKMIELDGTPNKSNIGANAILSVSQGVCEAAAASLKTPNYIYISHLYGLGKKALKTPIPTLNLINGGKHGGGNLDFQEYHLIPSSQKSYHEALRMAEEIYQQVKKILLDHGAVYGVGDEGGFAPNLFTNANALEILTQAVETSKYTFGKDASLGLDVAANYFYKEGKYKIRDRVNPMTTEELIEFYRTLIEQYPLTMLEDPLEEEDWAGWTKLSTTLPKIIVVGDDLLVTNKQRLEKAIAEKACGAVLVKPNQVGTISEAIEVIKASRRVGWKVIVSHRSGETNDDFIADFAVGVGADFAKFGAPARGERVVKYNRLLEIEKELESRT